MPTLTDILAARDHRYATELRLIAEHPNLTLVVLTVVFPGSVKRNADTLLVAQAACEEVERVGKGVIHFREMRDLPTGYEGFWLIDLPQKETKKKMVAIENQHPLGRLFDLDVIDSGGQPLSRQEAGEAPRRCLLCEQEARYCMRNQTHSYAEILQHIRQMIDAYVERRP